MKTCHSCNAEMPDDLLFCGKCGQSLEPPKRLCPKCGLELTESMRKFCGKCGADVTRASTPVIHAPQKPAPQQAVAPIPQQVAAPVKPPSAPPPPPPIVERQDPPSPPKAIVDNSETAPKRKPFPKAIIVVGVCVALVVSGFIIAIANNDRGSPPTPPDDTIWNERLDEADPRNNTTTTEQPAETPDTDNEPQRDPSELLDLGNRGITDEQLAEMIASGEIPGDTQLLNLYDNQICDISQLSVLTNLRELYLHDNPIDFTISGIESLGLYNLEILTLPRHLNVGDALTLVSTWKAIGAIPSDCEVLFF